MNFTPDNFIQIFAIIFASIIVIKTSMKFLKFVMTMAIIILGIIFLLDTNIIDINSFNF